MRPPASAYSLTAYTDGSRCFRASSAICFLWFVNMASARITRAPALSRVIAAKARSTSWEARASRIRSCTARARAAACASRSWGALPGFAGFQRTAIRDTFGNYLLEHLQLLADQVGGHDRDPVRFPPGRARLGTRPLPTGSITTDMTIGNVVVSCLAARAAAPPTATMTFAWTRTRSAGRGTAHSRPRPTGARWRCSDLLHNRAHADLRERPRIGAAFLRQKASRATDSRPEAAFPGAERPPQDCGSNPRTRSSWLQRQAFATRAAHATASSREGSSSTVKPPSSVGAHGWPPSATVPSAETSTGGTSSSIPPPKT